MPNLLKSKHYLCGTIALLLLLSSSNCFAIELTLVNNLKNHDQGKILEVEDARSVEAPKTKIRFKTVPGDKKEITGGNVTIFTVVRRYPKHRLKYQVTCDAKAKGKESITILQIHNNELPEGCKLARTGHWSKRSGMNWDGKNPLKLDHTDRS